MHELYDARMEELRDRVARGDLVHDVRLLLQSGAEDHANRLRDNIRHALAARRQDAVAVSALTGVAPGTVRGFLNGRPSSIRNVLLIAEAIGYTLAELDQPPEEFRRRVLEEGSEEDGSAIGPSLLAFERSGTAMAVVMLDGIIVKVNRQFRELLGYEESELIGASTERFAVRSDEDRALRQEDLAAGDAIPPRVTQLRRKDGSLISATTSALVVRDEDGQPRYVIARAAPVAGRAGEPTDGKDPVRALTPD